MAVFIDFCLFFAIWSGVSIFAAVTYPLFYALGVFLVLDIALTAFLGISVGRAIAGIRVLTSDGNAPGIGRALLRTGLVVVSGWIGFFVFISQVQKEANPGRMWWDAASGTSLTRATKLGSLEVGQGGDEIRRAVLLGFRLRDEDIAANEAGLQSGRQRLRAVTRASAYASGVPFGLLLTIVSGVALGRDGFTVRAASGLVLGLVIAFGAFVYSLDAWRDVLSGRVSIVDGIPGRGVEEDSTESGFVWRFPYLVLDGEHKLGWLAFRSIVAGRRYRLYVLPASGRCVGAVPLGDDQPPT